MASIHGLQKGTFLNQVKEVIVSWLPKGHLLTKLKKALSLIGTGREGEREREE